MTSPYMLDSLEFINLEGLALRNSPPETVAATAVPVQRPGVDGTGFITTGTKADGEFQMRSVADFTTQALAEVACLTYRSKKNVGLFQIVHAGTNYYSDPSGSP